MQIQSHDLLILVPFGDLPNAVETLLGNFIATTKLSSCEFDPVGTGKIIILTTGAQSNDVTGYC